MPDVSDDAVATRTGRTRREWFKELDKWGAVHRAHHEIASHLRDERGVEPWWAQMLTVEYERARGLRDVGQRLTGLYEASVQRTVDAPPRVVEHVLKHPDEWVEDPDVLLVLRSVPRASRTAQGKVLRYAEASARVEVTLGSKEDGRCVVRVVQGALASQDEREMAKKRWASVLDALKGQMRG